MYSFLLSWQRETRIRNVAGRLQGEVAYFAPCGKKLRQYPDVMKVNLKVAKHFLKIIALGGGGGLRCVALIDQLIWLKVSLL